MGSRSLAAMIVRFGFSAEFLANPVTWVVVLFIAIAAISAVRADRLYSQTCSDAAQVSFGVTGIPEYFVQPLDNQSYHLCQGRIPVRFLRIWPLTDCRPGGWSHWSDGTPAAFPQNCRASNGNRQMF